MPAKSALDRIDFGILTALQEDALLTNKALARRIGLAESSCLERVKALRARGVLKEAHIEVDPGAVGVALEALVAIRLVRHFRDDFQKLNAYFLSLPEVITVMHLTGAIDLQVHVAVRDLPHLRDLIVDKIATRPEVDHCETAVLFDIHRKHRIPLYGMPPEPVTEKPKARARSRR
jgi:DNA-binding Lrp family transcriptional regulator